MQAKTKPENTKENTPAAVKMWFSSRSQPNDSDRFRVSSIRNRMRSKKTTPKCAAAAIDVTATTSSTESNETNTACHAKPTIAPVGVCCCALQHPGQLVVGRNMAAVAIAAVAAATCPHCDNEAAASAAAATKEKNKTLRVDQKYKKNRITKSTSRNKVHELKTDKQIPCKNVINNNSQRKMSIPLLDVPPTITVATPKKSSNRRNGALNLNALLRYKSFISGSTKKLTSDDFDRLRRKSLGDTNAVRRKSNPDTNKKKSGGGGGGGGSNKKNKNLLLRPPNSFDTNNDSSTEDFHSCNEDDRSDDGDTDAHQTNECNGGGGGDDDDQCSIVNNQTTPNSIKATPRTKRNKKGCYKNENVTKTNTYRFVLHNLIALKHVLNI